VLKKIWIVVLAVAFLGAMGWAPVLTTAHAATKCECGKDCKCEHCATGKGECRCKGDKAGKGCQCGKGCGCEHCKTGKGTCRCQAGEKGCQCKGGGGQGCQCGKGCGCEHCKTGKGTCTCKSTDKAGCNCGKDCGCEHCKTGKGTCTCKSDGKSGCNCGKDCGCKHCKTGKGTCTCKSAGKSGCDCGKDCNCAHCAGDTAKSAASGAEKPASEADYAKAMVSKGGAFKVGYTSDPEAVPVNVLHSWKLKVETPDGTPIKDAEITVEGTMPAHGHGMPTQPKVTKNYGDGSYLVEGMKFSMPGWWVVTFGIKAGEKSDTVAFNLQLQ
jgi:hypothetical protein